MEARRLFLKSMGAVALAGWAAPLAAAAGPASAEPAAGPAVVAAGGVFLVNGWVLTGADLIALGLHAR